MNAPEFLDRDHLALVDRPDLHLGTECLDRAASGFDAFADQARDGDGAVVLDVDLGTGLFLNGTDHLAARADELADQFGVDLEADDARGVGVDLLARR